MFQRLRSEDDLCDKSRARDWFTFREVDLVEASYGTLVSELLKHESIEEGAYDSVSEGGSPAAHLTSDQAFEESEKGRIHEASYFVEPCHTH